jgi:hypothetical protein
MSIALQIRAIHEVSNDTIRNRLAYVRRNLKLTALDEVTLDQYLTIYKK